MAFLLRGNTFIKFRYLMQKPIRKLWLPLTFLTDEWTVEIAELDSLYNNDKYNS